MRYVRAIAYEIKSRLFDWSFAPIVGWGLACAFFLAFLALQWVHGRAVLLLQKAHYLLFRTGSLELANSPLNRLIEAALKRSLAQPGEPGVMPGRLQASDARQALTTLPGGLVLKGPHLESGRVVEKGVLLLKNTQQFRAFRQFADVASVLREYVLVLEPSWSGYAQADILYFTRFAHHPVVVMATDEQDYRFLDRLETNLVPVSFGASDWVDPSVFHPLEARDKHYDAVMVARWSIVKRHHVLFRALRKLGDGSFRVALLAPYWSADTDRRSIEGLMNFYGVTKQVTVFDDLTPVEVNEIFNRSKVNLLLSRQEGSNRSLFEGFFANTPGLAFNNNIGLPKSYFNGQTGKLIEEHQLADELRYFREHWQDFEPRAWAQTHITPDITTPRLGSLLKKLAQQRAEVWTHDIVAKCNGPNLRYYPAPEVGAGLPTITDLLAQHPRTGSYSARRNAV